MSQNLDKVVGLIKESFPLLKYTREKYVFYRGQRLFFDLVIPELSLYIEVQGLQHYRFVKFFHHTVDKLRKQKYRDQLKTEWCEENNKIFLSLSEQQINNLDCDAFKQLVLNKIQGFISGSSS